MPPRAIGASEVQQRLSLALQACPDIAIATDDFLDTALAGFDYTKKDLIGAVSSLYAEAYYRCAKDSDLSREEIRYLGVLQRLLRLTDDSAVKIAYRVGLAIYKKRFREAVSDGELTADETEILQDVKELFGLHKRDIRKAIAEQALAYYSFLLSDALRDGVLTDDEMARLADTARTLGLSSSQLATISVPNKREILSTALAAIKAKGVIQSEDYDHIRSLAEYLNASELLSACLMDLELYERIFAIRAGQLPIIDSHELLLERGERLHYAIPATLETTRGGRIARHSGTLYIGSQRIRFVGLRRSHELRYQSLLQIDFQILKQSKLTLTVAQGGGGGVYRPKRNDPGLLVEVQEAIRFLVRKAKGFEGSRGRDTRYISAEVRSEVWYRDNAQCVICGATEYLEFDHIIPHSKGGATSVDNLQLLCRGCNSRKSDNI